MDAVEFLKEYKRMCNQIACESCPLYSNGGCDVLISFPRSLDLRECVEAVEQWTKEHPTKTRQSEFLKMFPNVRMVEGIVHISPCTIDNSIWENCNERTRYERCSECRRDYWLQEVE